MYLLPARTAIAWQTRHKECSRRQQEPELQLECRAQPKTTTGRTSPKGLWDVPMLNAAAIVLHGTDHMNIKQRRARVVQDTTANQGPNWSTEGTADWVQARWGVGTSNLARNLVEHGVSRGSGCLFVLCPSCGSSPRASCGLLGAEVVEVPHGRGCKGAASTSTRTRTRTRRSGLGFPCASVPATSTAPGCGET